jgi:hypothetical protein
MRRPSDLHSKHRPLAVLISEQSGYLSGSAKITEAKRAYFSEVEYQPENAIK